jgi:RHS repeat-associated protein
VVGTNTYNLTYDSENRLTGVSGGASATFVYDGDGKRVKGTVGGATTVYVGDDFEWTGSTSTMKKYYAIGGQRVAMQVGNSSPPAVYYLLVDHLGSTSLTANSSGGRVAEVHYKPWGEDLWTYGTTPTTYRYTGQRVEAGIGLYFYNARWYDPQLGRFIQPDTFVPLPSNPQTFSRYSCALNNPLRYVDPTGHFTEDELIAWGLYTQDELYAMRNGLSGQAMSEWYQVLMAARNGYVLEFGDARENGSGYFHVVKDASGVATGLEIVGTLGYEDDESHTSGVLTDNSVLTWQERFQCAGDLARGVPTYGLWKPGFKKTLDAEGMIYNLISGVAGVIPEPITQYVGIGVSVFTELRTIYLLAVDATQNDDPPSLADVIDLVAGGVAIAPGPIGSVGDAVSIYASLSEGNEQVPPQLRAHYPR